MKKIIVFLLILTFLITGCTQKNVPDNTVLSTTTPASIPATTSSTDEPSEPVVVLQADMFAVALPCSQSNTTAENGNTVFSQSIQSLQLWMPDPDVANKVIIDFGAKQDKFIEAADAIKNIALQNNANGNSEQYFYHALYDHVRMDENILSLAGAAVQNSGGIHPDYIRIYANYSMVTGDFLTLGSILTHADRADDLCQLLIEAIDNVKADYGIWDEYEDFIRSRFEGDISNDSSWYFSSEGLCFSFSPYEIAPYASGVISVTIPYEKLTDIIEGEYFPVERDNASGALVGQLLNEENAMLYPQTSEIVLSENGTMILLSTDSAIYDVCIEVGRWDYGVYDASYVALFRSALTPGDAIMLQADLPDADSPVRITYRSGDEIKSQFITMSDNTVVFTTEE